MRFKLALHTIHILLLKTHAHVIMFMYRPIDTGYTFMYIPHSDCVNTDVNELLIAVMPLV